MRYIVDYIIQIQHLLKLNNLALLLINLFRLIQIQHLLKLNLIATLINTYKNIIQIQHLLKLNLYLLCVKQQNKLNSNTTFVKVKYMSYVKKQTSINKFKYNIC